MSAVGAYHPSYDMPLPDRWTHLTAVRGCWPDCPACEHEAEMDERAAS